MGGEGAPLPRPGQAGVAILAVSMMGWAVSRGRKREAKGTKPPMTISGSMCVLSAPLSLATAAAVWRSAPLGHPTPRPVQAGCDDYHAKPVELPRLVAQMEALLARAATV